MPHVTIQCYKGRSYDQLQRIAEKVAICTAEEFGLDISSVSVSVEETDRENWPDVYNNDIYGGRGTLFIKPRYRID